MAVSGTVLQTTYLYQIPYYRQPACIKYRIKDHLSVSGTDIQTTYLYQVSYYRQPACIRYCNLDHISVSDSVLQTTYLYHLPFYRPFACIKLQYDRQPTYTKYYKQVPYYRLNTRIRYRIKDHLRISDTVLYTVYLYQVQCYISPACIRYCIMVLLPVSGTVLQTTYLNQVPYYRQPTCVRYCIIHHLLISGSVFQTISLIWNTVKYTNFLYLVTAVFWTTYLYKLQVWHYRPPAGVIRYCIIDQLLIIGTVFKTICIYDYPVLDHLQYLCYAP